MPVDVAGSLVPRGISPVTYLSFPAKNKIFWSLTMLLHSMASTEVLDLEPVYR